MKLVMMLGMPLLGGQVIYLHDNRLHHIIETREEVEAEREGDG